MTQRRRPVLTLPPEVARKIAAGEVIDRPASIVRELMDNAVDAGASSITVEIEGGGINRIRVSDNGNGMTHDDLEHCARPHTTSKITSETDLLSLKTLGFRGEALASMAAVSRLEITSIDKLHTEVQPCAWKLQPSITGRNIIVPAQLACGTVVQTEALFEDFPARRHFLKRPQTEGQLCKQIFAEKALPRPDIAFRLIMDGKLRLNLPKGQSAVQRCVDALELEENEKLFTQLQVSSEICENGIPQWNVDIVIGEPSIYRNDRRYIYIYANGRRITEYSLMQAIEYGGQGYFPNGTHPVAVLYLNINPALVDFNIHPAKREARFRDLSEVHRAISKTVREYFRQYTLSHLTSQDKREYATDTVQELFTDTQDTYANQRSFTPLFHNKFESPPASHTYTCDGHELHEQFVTDSFTISKPTESILNTSTHELPDDFPVYEKNTTAQTPALTSREVILYGTALGVFLIAEKNNILYLIDQHAAHERILFDAFISCAGKKQRLLIPYIIETESTDDDDYLRSICPALENAGFDVQEKHIDGDKCQWQFNSVPAQWHGTQDNLVEDLLSNRVSPADIMYSLAGTAACRSAVKDGDILDPQTALNLAEQALSLSDPHCPHGRPIWITLTKTELFRLVRRIE